MKSTWLTKQIYKKALIDSKVYIRCQNQGRNGVTKYGLSILRRTRRDNGTYDTRLWDVCGHSNYWSEKLGCYRVTCWGTSRPLEIILDVGYSLGLDFHDIKQNFTVLN